MVGALINPKVWLLLMILVLGAGCLMAIAVPMPSFQGAMPDHAMKHGADAVASQQCFQSNGTMQIWQRPDGRTLYVCQINDRDFGLSIQDPGESEPFNYFKQSRTTLEKLMRWLQNTGYTRIQ